MLPLLLLLIRPPRLNRSYLRKSSLLTPRTSAWQKLFQARDDLAFRNTMSLTVKSFFQLHRALQSRLESPRRPDGQSLPRPRLLDTYAILGLTLHWLNTSAPQKTLCQIFGVVPAVCCRGIKIGLTALTDAFAAGEVDQARICWPSHHERIQYASTITNNYPDILPYQPFAFMDGVRWEIQAPTDLLLQNAYYSGKEKMCCIGSVMVYAPDGTILWWRGNCPGSWHDITIAAPFLDYIRTSLSDGQCVLADCGFAREDLASCLLISKTLVQLAEADMDEEEMVHAASVTAARQAAEWGMRALNSTFGRLHAPLPLTARKRLQLLTVCMHLHNYIVRTVEVNQIRTVYDRYRVNSTYMIR